MAEEETFSEKISRLAYEKYKRVMADRERYVEAWFAETGLLPSECELVEEVLGDMKIIHMRKRENG